MRGWLHKSPVRKGREEEEQGWMGEAFIPHTQGQSALHRAEHCQGSPSGIQDRAPGSGVDPGCTDAPSPGQLTPLWVS